MTTPAEQLRALLLGDAFKSDVLADLAPALPARHVGRALHIATTAAFLRYRTRAAVVARAIEGDLDPDQREAVTHALVRDPSLLTLGEGLRFRSEPILKTGLTDPSELAWFLERGGPAREPWVRALLLQALGRSIPRLGEDAQAQDACLRLLPYAEGALTQDLARDMAAGARRVEDPSTRAHLLAAALPALAGDERALAQAAAIEAARATEDAAARAEALLRVADNVPNEEQPILLDEVRSAARLLEVAQTPRVRLLAEVALRVDEPERTDVLREAREPYEEGQILWPSADEVLAEAYGDIARTLPARLRGRLAEAVAQLQPSDAMFQGLVPYLSESQLEAALTDAIDPDRAPRIGAPVSRLAGLAPMLTPRLLVTAVQRIANAPRHDPERQARWIVDIADVLPEGLATGAAEIAVSLPDPWWSGRALDAILPRLPEPVRAAYAERARAVAPERLRGLLLQMPPEEQDQLLDEYFEEVWQRCAGAGPPVCEAAPPEPDATIAEPPDEKSAAAAPAPALPPIASAPAASVEESAATATVSPKVVNTGFAAPPNCAAPLARDRPLRAGEQYFFWLEVGAAVAGAIDTLPTAIPVDLLPDRPRLQVALFGFPGELELVEGHDVGELEILADGTGRVVRPCAEPCRAEDARIGRRRLFFPVGTPARAGTFRLRCNIYCRQVLVQSHLVTAEVRTAPAASRLAQRIRALLSGRRPEPALRTTADYTLSHSLRGSDLERIEPHRLSIMLNDNGEGNFGFRFFGSDGEEFKSESTLAELEVQDLVGQARAAMRMSCWGRETPWAGEPYRYDGAYDRARLFSDLVRFARGGYRFYDALVERLAGAGSSSPAEKRKAVQRLAELMRRPGFVQVASKLSARHVIPAAMLYDRPFDSDLRESDYSLCDGFEAALHDGTTLWDAPCFRGECPSHGKRSVVCPGGFWGFRHALGLPVSVADGQDQVASVGFDGAPGIAVAVSTDPGFTLRPAHERKLQGLFAATNWAYANTRAETIELLKECHAQVLYFYCHGGVSRSGGANAPFLQFGPLDEPGITRDVLRGEDVFWNTPQPLVFINGCQTAALEPEQALDFVTAFVGTANAAGVIGTEVTIFEPLACAFAENCLALFAGGEPIGEAVRKARLDLLAAGNPLGLVYIPFVVAHLKLVAATV